MSGMETTLTGQVGFTLRGRNPDVLTCIANLSNDEVFTPPEFAKQELRAMRVWRTTGFMTPWWRGTKTLCRHDLALPPQQAAMLHCWRVTGRCA